ncbi:HlyD family secretion protein [Salinisphaera sp. LB1]|uniref:HlyD family secretion protein n=1 Tax=Salinisphaera sp. LB1 TaxID=2183911 RepID=UPI000D707351|nr:HlyD family secretion protein [Salinisphaera sp. LB1]AWN14884.1 Membrane fusion component of tripartite multidrug resistance system [Salinisphaera sp. LB1]
MSSTDHASEQTAEPATPPQKRNGKGRRVALIAVTLVVVCGLLWFVWWFLHRNDVSTDDAYVQANIGQIAPRVTGTVAKVFVRDNEHVKKGDVLFTLDPADFKAALAKAEANLQAAKASYNASQKDLSVTRQTSAADIDNAKAALESAQAEAQRAEADAKRYRALYAKHEVSKQQLDQKNTQAKSAEARERQARAKLAQAKASPDRIQLKQSQASSAKAKIAQARAQVDQARLNLSYTEIRASHAGKIAKKSIVAGSQISAGQSAMALVQTHPWVVANYKETQLDRVRPGQPVSIAIDAYPDHEFTGRVESIQPGTGVTFSLLPPQNATGNFVKIVQRVPVKIIFSKPAQLKGLDVSPGLSVEPTINVAGPIKHLDRDDIPATETGHAQ